MEAFEGEGVFWLPGHKDDQVAGRITFDPEAGTTLKLIGGFNHFLETPDPSVRIVGLAAGKELTLDKCFRTNWGLEAPGVERETYYANQVLAGNLYGANEELIFDTVIFLFDHLVNLMELSLLKIDHQFGTAPGSSVGDKITAVLEGFSKEKFPFEGGYLTLGSSWKSTGDRVNEVTLGQTAYLRIDYSNPRPLEDILFNISSLQDLITLTTDSPASPLYVKLGASRVLEDDGHESNNGQAQRFQVDFYAPQSSRRVVSSPDMLVTLKQIGGPKTLASWIDLARKYRPVLGHLMTVRYSKFIYVENRFSNVVTSAEAFHRLRFSNALRPSAEFEEFRQRIVDAVPEEHQTWLKKQLQFSNEPRLRHRIDEMLEFAGPDFAQIVSNPTKWAQVVVQVRNRMTHQDKRKRLKIPSADLRFLSESVYFLVMFCLLRECGVTGEVLTSVAEHPAAQFLTEKIKKIVEN